MKNASVRSGSMDRIRKLGVAVALTAFSLGFSSPAYALVVSGASSAYGESIDVTLDPILIGATIGVTSGPLPSVAGTAPAPYSLSDSLASIIVSPVASTGLLVVTADSDVDGGLGARSADATASVDLLSILAIISATTVQSTAEVSGDFGALVPTGTTTIEGLTVLGIPIVVGATPNLEVSPLVGLGLSILLNEQILVGDGSSFQSIEVNAIHISFTNFTLGLNVLDGDIIISHSFAQLAAVPNPAAVPEPGTLLLLGSGMTALGFFGKRRSTRA